MNSYSRKLNFIIMCTDSLDKSEVIQKLNANEDCTTGNLSRHDSVINSIMSNACRNRNQYIWKHLCTFHNDKHEMIQVCHRPKLRWPQWTPEKLQKHSIINGVRVVLSVIFMVSYCRWTQPWSAPIVNTDFALLVIGKWVVRSPSHSLRPPVRDVSVMQCVIGVIGVIVISYSIKIIHVYTFIQWKLEDKEAFGLIETLPHYLGVPHPWSTSAFA